MMVGLCGWRPQADITMLDAKTLSRLAKADAVALEQIIDTLGAGSARAQRLGAVITTFDKLMISPGQRLYLVADRCAHRATAARRHAPDSGPPPRVVPTARRARPSAC